MIEALKILAKAGSDIIIISDSNSIYIEQLLEVKIVHCISPICLVDFDETRQFIRRNTTYESEFLRCADTEKGLLMRSVAKGKELLDYIAMNGEYERLVYVGDGRNDFCPSTKLSSRDLVLPRTNRSFANLLKDIIYREQIVAQVEEWDTAEDLREIFKNHFGQSPS
ncbi:hypothetical protein HK097_005649 [Rhizophlyctis rosea]|uniref:Uncharacterized protein n=1 Tax=Rhizophlyctis rosea TaxID=64517 RepID=A0AAD5WYA9_9FUNG|nr:hypothetical protein HK097_005649 [Rhizophlyctis rosea]